MHIIEVGSGPAVMLLHGWPGCWFDYRHVVHSAARLGRCVALDFFGFGESSPLSGDPAQVADEEFFAADVVELMDALKISDAIIAGHDIGSAVAPAAARLAPERVRGLVLMNPTHPFIGAKRYTPEAQREAWYQHFHLLPPGGGAH